MSDEAAATWASVVAAGLHQLVTDIDAAITAIDQEVQAQRVVRHALRSSVSGVLGRSMAHDVGSHMLAKAELPTTDRNALAATDPERRPEAAESPTVSAPTGNEAAESAKADEAPAAFFKHIKEYIRHRMVFIAEAATSEPFWQQPLPLKHVVDTFRWYAGPGSTKQSSAPCVHLAESEDVWVKELDDHSLSGDVFVGLPTGLVGAQALYCIFENVIRNGAKHRGDIDPTREMSVAHRGRRLIPMVLHLRVFEPDLCDETKGLLGLRIWDSLSEYRSDKFLNIQSYYPHKSVAGKSGVETVASTPQPSFAPDPRLIDEEGKQVRGGWGIKEMRIAAAWLLGGQRRLVDLLWDDEQGLLRIPLVRPVCVDEDGKPTDGVGWMGVELHLQIPKEVVVVSQDLMALPKSTRSALVDVGVAIYPTVASALNAGWRSARVLIVDCSPSCDASALQAVKDYREELPLPVLVAAIDQADRDTVPMAVALDPSEWTQVKESLSVRQAPRCLLAPLLRWLRQHFAVYDPLPRVVLALARGKAGGAIEAAAKETEERWDTIVTEGSDHFAVINAVPQAEPAVLRAPPLFTFEHHGVLTKIRPRWNRQVSDYAFVEEFDSLSLTHELLLNPPRDDYYLRALSFDLMTAATTQVWIIDERLAKMESAPELGVLIMSDGFNGMDYSRPRPFLDGLASGAKELPLLPLMDFKRMPSVLVIHQGVLDKAYPEPEGKDNAEIWVRRMVAGRVRCLVVTSDRGPHLLEKLPPSARFLPHSIVEAAVTTKSKLALVQALLAARSQRDSANAPIDRPRVGNGN